MPDLVRLLARPAWAGFSRLQRVSAALVAAVLLIAASAWADSSVLLVVKGGLDQDSAPFELRLRSEFAAEGLEVVTASGRSQQNLLDLEGLARRTGAVAALSVYVDAQGVQGRLWVSDPNFNADLVRTLHVTRADGDIVSLFALRAVEALRGARLELEQQRRHMSEADTGPSETGAAAATDAKTPPNTSPSSPVPASSAVSAPKNPNPVSEVKQTTAPPPSTGKPRVKNATTEKRQARARWAVVVGAAAGYEPNGLGGLGAPALDVRWWVWDRLTLGASFDGPFILRRSYPMGVVEIDQELVDLQMRLRALSAKRVALEGILSTGPSRFAVTGKDVKSGGPAQSGVSLGWTFGGGLGSQFFLTEHWIISLDFLWLRRLPAPWVKVANAHVTGQTDSLILGKLGMGVVF